VGGLLHLVQRGDSKVMVDTHYPCSRAVNAAREHGRHFWTPVNTAYVNTCDRLVTNTAREHGCNFVTPVFTGRENGCPKLRPCSRSTDHGSCILSLTTALHRFDAGVGLLEMHGEQDFQQTEYSRVFAVSDAACYEISVTS